MKVARPIQIFLQGTYVQLQMNRLVDLDVDVIKYRIFDGNPMMGFFCKNGHCHPVLGSVNIPNMGPR
jgi:hypothetical protein